MTSFLIKYGQSDYFSELLSRDFYLYPHQGYHYNKDIMSKIAYFTQEGYDKIAEELEDLKTRGRSEAAKAIAEAREKGDLSENAEYDAAKDAQGMLEMKIHGLESSIANAQIIDSSKVDTSQVSILTKVKIKNLKVNREMTYQIVSESEANLKAKKLSIDSPIGKGLVGKKIGDIADIQTPAGMMKFEILDITV